MRILITFFLLLPFIPGHAQCPGSLACEGAETLCSFDALNGFTCNNPSQPSADFPLTNLCFGAGMANNLIWWAFAGCGGQLILTFELTPDLCDSGQGIQAGIFAGDCSGTHIFDCDPGCNASNFSLAGTTDPCETYYVWVDGCNFDVCTYTIRVDGMSCTPQLPSQLPPIEFNGTVCPCSSFEVCLPKLAGDCAPRIYWEVDGLQAGKGECQDIIVEENASEGEEIEVCAIVTIGNPDNPDAICDQAKVCTTLVVETIAIAEGPSLAICEKNIPYTWNGVLIDASCINPPCTTRVVGIDGCCIDTVQSIEVLPLSDTVFVDTFLCSDGFLALPNGDTLSESVCDTSVFILDTSGCEQLWEITMAKPSFTVVWNLDTIGQTLCATIERDTVCGYTYTEDINSTWYKDGEFLATLPEDSCLQLDDDGVYLISLTSLDTLCVLEFTDSINIEAGYGPKEVKIIGPDTLCRGDSIEIFAEGDFDQYVWDTGDTASSIFVQVGGEYCVTGYSLSDTCTATTCIDIFESYIEITDVNIIPDNGTNSGSISLTIEGTDRPFQLIWSNGDTTDFIVGLKAGDYLLRITNQAGCSYLFEYEVKLGTSTFELGKVLDVFPNPTSDKVWVKHDQVLNYTWMTLSGTAIESGQTSSGVHEMNISALPAGTYFLVLESSEGKQALRTIVVK